MHETEYKENKNKIIWPETLNSFRRNVEREREREIRDNQIYVLEMRIFKLRKTTDI